MRIWDLPVTVLCNKHLVAEHCELHVLWNCITQNRKGWSHHPEAKRWKAHLRVLYQRHLAQKIEFARRKFNHNSELDSGDIFESLDTYPEMWQSREEQIEILVNVKRCSGCTRRIRRWLRR